MAAPYRLTRSVLPIKVPIREPLAVTWNNATIVYDCLHDMIHYHHSGEWLIKESKRNGCNMPTPFQEFLIVQVINDKMIVVDLGKINISSLDLNTWIWEKCKPKGKPPKKAMVLAHGFTNRRFIFLEVEVSSIIPILVDLLNSSAITIPTIAGNGPCKQGISLLREAATTP